MKNILLKRFNKVGEKKFNEFFLKKLKNKNFSIPFRNLKDERYTEIVNDKEILIDLDLKFNSAFDFGKYIHDKIKDIKNARFDTGLFHWITLAYFNSWIRRHTHTGWLKTTHDYWFRGDAWHDQVE